MELFQTVLNWYHFLDSQYITWFQAMEGSVICVMASRLLKSARVAWNLRKKGDSSLWVLLKGVVSPSSVSSRKVVTDTHPAWCECNFCQRLNSVELEMRVIQYRINNDPDEPPPRSHTPQDTREDIRDGIMSLLPGSRWAILKNTFNNPIESIFLYVKDWLKTQLDILR